MMPIIDDVKYKIVEHMGFQHSAGVYAAIVAGPDGNERVAQRHPGGEWRFRTPYERVAPLVEWATKCAQKSEYAGLPSLTNDEKDSI